MVFTFTCKPQVALNLERVSWALNKIRRIRMVRSPKCRACHVSCQVRLHRESKGLRFNYIARRQVSTLKSIEDAEARKKSSGARKHALV